MLEMKHFVKNRGRPVVNHDHLSHEQTMLNEVNMDFRIPGLPHSVVKHAQSTSVRELIQKIENHPDRHALQQYLRQNYYKNKWWLHLNKTIEKTFWFQASVVYLRTFTPRSCRRTNRAHSLLEEQTMEVGIEFVLYLVGMARLLVVFLKKIRKSRKRQAKSWERSGWPFVYSTLAKTSEDGFQEFILFCYR